LKALHENVLFARRLEVWQLRNSAYAFSDNEVRASLEDVVRARVFMHCELVHLPNSPSRSVPNAQPTTVVADAPAAASAEESASAVAADPTEQQHVTVRLLGATGLAQPDVFVESCPICVLRWNGGEIRRTEPARRTQNPVWPNLVLVLPLDSSAPGQLVVELWDDETIGSGESLGQVEIDAAMLLDPPTGRQELPLSAAPPNRRLNAATAASTKQRRAQGKLLLEVMSGQVAIDVQGQQLVRDLRLWLRVVSAANLSPSAVNAFCVIKWNGAEAGRTAVIPATTSPEWDSADFVIPISLDSDWLEGTLVIEVWDHRKGMMASDEMVGAIELQVGCLRA
jgi:hypothetical protein